MKYYKKKLTCEIIKLVVDRKCDIDIGVYSRDNNLPLYRFVYFKLCRKFTKSTYQEIAKTVNLKQHSTVINGLKKFDELSGTKFFKIYDEIHLDLTLGLYKDEYIELKTIEEASKYYRAQFIILNSEYIKIINKLQNEILTKYK